MDPYWGPFSRAEDRNDHYSRPSKTAKGQNINASAENTSSSLEENIGDKKRPGFAPFCNESDTTTNQSCIGVSSDNLRTSSQLRNTKSKADSVMDPYWGPFSRAEDRNDHYSRPSKTAKGQNINASAENNTSAPLDRLPIVSNFISRESKSVSWKQVLLTPFSNTQEQIIRRNSDTASFHNSHMKFNDNGHGGWNPLISLSEDNSIKESTSTETFFKSPKFCSWNNYNSETLSVDLNNNIMTTHSLTPCRSPPARPPPPAKDCAVVDLTDSPSSLRVSNDVDMVPQKPLTKSQKRKLARRRKRMRKKKTKLCGKEADVFDNLPKENVEVIDLVNDSEDERSPEHNSSPEVLFDQNISTEMEVGTQDDETEETKSHYCQDPNSENYLLGVEMDEEVIVEDDVAVDQSSWDQNKHLNRLNEVDTLTYIEDVKKKDLELIKMKLIEKKSELERARLQLSIAQMNKSEALTKARAQLAAAWEKKEMALKAKLSKQITTIPKVADQFITDVSSDYSNAENQQRIDVQAFSMKSLLISNIGSHPDERHRQIGKIDLTRKVTRSNKDHSPAKIALPQNKADMLRLGLELAKRRLKLAELQKLIKLKSKPAVICKDADKIIGTECETRNGDQSDACGVPCSSSLEMKEFDGALLLGMIHKQQILLRQHKENLHKHTVSLQECQSSLEEEKKLHNDAEQHLLDLMQRKDGTERMVRSITKKIMRLRRRRYKIVSSEGTGTSL